MSNNKIGRYFLIFLLLVFLYLGLTVVAPLLKNVAMALILAFAFYPIYKFFLRKTGSPNWSSTIMILFLLLIIIVPGVFIVNSLISQTTSAYALAQNFDFRTIESVMPGFISDNLNIDLYLEDIILKVRNYIVNYAPDFIGSVAEMMLGLFVMFFVIFYAFRNGEEWLHKLKEWMPMKTEYTDKLYKNTEEITNAVIYGYIMTAVIQGILGGFVFLILGIPNPVFWGFLMMILAAIPFLGTPIIWLPTAIVELAMGNYFSGIFLLVFGFLILINIDNVLRPKFIESKSKAHPAVILVGLIGGLSVFGFSGIIIGPLILTLLFVIVEFFMLEFEH